MKYLSSNTDSQGSDRSTSVVQPVDLVMHNKMFLHKWPNSCSSCVSCTPDICTLYALCAPP